VRGVETGRDYQVELRLLEPDTRKVLSTYTRSFQSELDQAQGSPDRPLVVGPGYAPNPALGRESAVDR
jgi:hypothetical protein